MFLGLLDWSDFQDFLLVAKKLLKTLQALRRAQVSFFLFQIQNQHHYPPPQNKTFGIPLWFLQPIMGKTESHCPSTSRRTCPEPCNRRKQEPQRQVPVTYTAKADGVPSYSGSLSVSGTHLPTPGHCGDGGSEPAKAMLAIWRCKLPVWETLALAWWLRH